MAETLKMDEKERQAKVSSLLHGTEASIKKGDLEDGLEKVRAVYAYDSRNLYAHAFEERIISLIAKRAEKSEPPPEPPQPIAIPQEQPEPGPASQGENPVRDEMQSMFDMERAKWEEEKAFIIDREQLKTKERLLLAYRAFVTLMDVSIAKEHLDSILLSLRGILGVTDQEHAEIIRSVQTNGFTDTPGGIADSPGCILAVDDSRDILMFIEYVLKKRYTNVRTAGSIHEAAEVLRSEVPALIICDVMMPEVGGFAFYDMIKRGEFGEEVKKIPFVFMSVSSDEYMKKVAGDLGARMYLTKPFSRDVLERTVNEMLHL